MESGGVVPPVKEQTMANITRFDPFNELDDLFKGFFVRPMRLDLPGMEPVQMKVDVTRTDDTYTVKADLPGVAKDDIKVSIDGGQVSISGEIRKEKDEKKGEEIVRSERYYGKVARSFTLPQEIDQARVEAKYADGVLRLTLPLKAKSAGRAIAIQ